MPPKISIHQEKSVVNFLIPSLKLGTKTPSDHASNLVVGAVSAGSELLGNSTVVRVADTELVAEANDLAGSRARL